MKHLLLIAIIIGLDFVSSATPGFRGKPFDFSWPRFLAHLGYLNAFVGYAWYNPVFWSLAIEFQWYLLSGLLFMAFSHTSRAVRWGTFSAFGLLPFLMPADGLVFRYLPLFSFGIATYQLRTGLLAKLEYFVICAVCTFLCVLNMTVAIAAVGLVTALMIAFLDFGPSLLLRAGAISYSLYLLHIPIGGRVINLSSRLPDNLALKVSALAAATVVSIAASYYLWRWVERPALQWARRVPYHSTSPCSEISREPSQSGA